MKSLKGKKWIQQVVALLMVPVMCQNLALPALTLEREPLCGKQEHQHGDICYSVQEILACQAEVHIHQETCMEETGQVACGYEDYLLHTHGEHCFDRTGNLVCLLPEKQVHTHGENCWQAEEEEEPVLICELPELAAHSHSENCWTEGVLQCGISELREHSHDESCLEHQTVLECSQEEHIHDESCFQVEQLIEPEETMEPEETTVETTLPTEPPVVMLAEEPTSEMIHTAESREDDVGTVSADGIRFRLFNYSLDINKDASLTGWRAITPYFTFRNSKLTKGDSPSETVHIPTEHLNAAHDADGFPAAHATVERTLQNGMPVLDLSRNADGTTRTDPGLGADVRSLAYLFGGIGDHAVTAYYPGNTILQKSGNHYFYNSRDNAVDFDTDADLFRVRSYAERNSTTATYGTGYGDFLPFDYTGGETVHDPDTETTPYHLMTEDVDYWFGMTMDVDFYQSRDGFLGQEHMVFRFSGDDDVWVFVDDVLVLDLGGTHGTVEGSIDFATGEILQYLTWGGANATEEAKIGGSTTSFPTTLRDCFDAAGRAPNGGWDESGATFADYTKHTLRFFYLERGSAVANCKIDFSLPTLPDKSLTVSKELQAEQPLQEHLSKQLSYRFRVAKPDGSLFLNPGTSYTLMKSGEPVGTGIIDADGTFSLYPGQSAQFTRMLEKGGGEKAYIVQELLPDSLTGQYSGIEYSVNGAGGSTVTEEGPETGFTAYETDLLSAEQSQLVTFRNRVDTAKLCRLSLSKLQAEGSRFPVDAVFPVQVKLGGEPLPAGTEYEIDGERFTVSTPGIVPLKIGQTASLTQGILSGTEYVVTELDTEDCHYRAHYSGTVTPEGTVTCTDQGAEGSFPLNSQVHVTITNASYDFAVKIPLSKRAEHHLGEKTFSFQVQQVFPSEDGGWEMGEMLPGTDVTVTDDDTVEGIVSIGYQTGTAGDFYYRISEIPGKDSFVYDRTYYLVCISAEETAAQITGIWKNGEEDIPVDTVLSFVNHRTASLEITKELAGGDPKAAFSFTVEVLWDGQHYIPEDWETSDDGCLHFSLCHGENIILTGIPWGAEVTVREEPHANYIPSYQIDIQPEQEGNTARVTMDRDAVILHFINRSAYQLPQTGGSGTALYAQAALAQMTAAVSLLYFQRKRDRKK